jgi:hypothetical protein
MQEEPIEVIPSVEKLSLHEIKERVVKFKDRKQPIHNAYKWLTDKIQFGHIVLRDDKEKQKLSTLRPL